MRGPASRARPLLAIAPVAAIALGACGDGAPTEGTYALAFPSVAAAVATETIEVSVFDASSAQRATLCGELLRERRTSGLRAPLASTGVVRVCEVGGGRGALTVGYGARAFLAVGKRGGADFLVGCALEELGSGDAPTRVYLAPAGVSVSVPATACSTLSDACAGRCK